MNDESPHESAPGPTPEPERPPRGRRRRLLLGLAWATGGLVLLAAVGGGLLYWKLSRNLRTVDISGALGSDRPSASGNGALDILVLGSDSRSGANGQLAGGPTDGTARSDTAMIVHVNERHTAADVVSIPRDTLVSRPSCTSTGNGSGTAAGVELPAVDGVMFNTAYEVGGPVCAVKTVESMTGLRMDHFIEVDFVGFARLIDALGGVTVTTTVPIDDNLSGLHLAAGTHHLDGDQALAFVRTRHGVGDGSDLGRIELQQQMVRSMLTQAEGLDLLGDPARLYDLADTATSALTTDSDLGSVASLISFANGLTGIHADDITSVTMPNTPAPSDPNRLVAREPQATALWTALRNGQPIPASVLALQLANPADSTAVTASGSPSAAASGAAGPAPASTSAAPSNGAVSGSSALAPGVTPDAPATARR